MNTLKLQFLASVLAASSFVCAGLIAAPQPKSDTAAGAQPNQKQFNTPKEAADSLVQAAVSFDVPALKEILGPDANDIVSSEDPVADKNKATAFAAKAKEKDQCRDRSEELEPGNCDRWQRRFSTANPNREKTRKVDVRHQDWSPGNTESPDWFE